jgi:hypothetical protein
MGRHGVSSPDMTVHPLVPSCRRKAMAVLQGAAYSPPIDFPNATIFHPNTDPKEHTMNTTHTNNNAAPQASRSAHIASLGLATVLTVAMLFGANLMATSDVSPNGFLQVMAQAHSARA